MTSTYVQKAIDVGLVAYASSDYVIKSLHDYGEKLRANRYGDNANEELERACLKEMTQSSTLFLQRMQQA